MISSIKRYFELLGWLLADMWGLGRGSILAVYGLDVIGLVTMAGAYGLGKKILGQVNGKTAAVQIGGAELSVLGAIGIAAGLIMLALLVQSATRLGSHRLALNLAVRYEAATVIRIWDKIRWLKARSKGDLVLPKAQVMHNLLIATGRALGNCARLGVMAISGALTAVAYAALAIHSAPKTAFIFLVVGLGIFGFILRNNQQAALANRRSRDLAIQTKLEVADLFRSLEQDGDEAQVDQRLRVLYRGGVGGRTAQARSEQLFRVYQSQFLMSAGGALAMALALLLPILELPKGGAAVPVAMTAASLVLLKLAFGFAGAVAGHLTRLNLRYHLLVEHRRFLKTGQLPAFVRDQAPQDDLVEDE